MKRIYHPYWLWEDFQHGMYRVPKQLEIPKLLTKAIEFTEDFKLYGSFMSRVANEWKHSCEHNLTNKSLNRKAWIGHAACALAFRCPEKVVCSAWWSLTKEQRLNANNIAKKVIEEWEVKFLKSNS